MGSHGKSQSCTHCGCENPVWNALRHTVDLKAFANTVAGMLPEPDSESLIFTGGTIYPLIDGNMTEQVDALGIHGGDVVASGTLDYVQQRMNERKIKFTIYPLNGKTLLPGLVEPHAHIVQSCVMSGWVDMGPIDPMTQHLHEQYDWAYLKKRIDENLPRDDKHWILGHMVDPALMPLTVDAAGNKQLTHFYCKADFNPADDNTGNLDSIVSQYPLLMMSASMHTVYLNTLACNAVWAHACKHDDGFRQQYPTAQDFVDATQGNLQEVDGTMLAIKAIPLSQALDVVNIFKYMKDYFETASKRGITLLYDAMVDPVSKVILEAYGLTHPRNLRIGYAASCNGKDFSHVGTYKPVTKEAARLFYQGSVKLISDGSNQGLTGYQSQPYCCEAHPPEGNFNFCDPGKTTPETVPQAYQTTLDNAIATGWPLMIHANGDRAIEFTLQAYKTALKGQSGLEKRHRIEHCSLLDTHTLDQLKDLGISPSFLIGHVGYWGNVFQQAIFKSRANMLDLCRDALDHDLRISLHSDCTVTPLGPLRSMEQAVTRKMEGMRQTEDGPFISHPDKQLPLNEGQCLSREQALKAITYDAAWQCHADTFTGSLKDGHFADFVILAKNPLDQKVPATDIRGIKVCETWKGGHKVYANARP